jgi:hypothetical protein
MLKKAAGVVLASLRGSTYGPTVCLASSLAAVWPDSLFDHPANMHFQIRDVSQRG